MVLLQLLHELAGEFSWRLTVAHLNHQLRGRASDADERLVVRTAKAMRLPVVVGRGDVKQLARAKKLSLEMAARQARHDFLARTARRLKIRSVALAHHADDQLELFFLRLLRGSGSEGLAGMSWKNSSPSDARIELVRPLLGESKAALLAFAEAQQIPFREDASNASLDIQRNRIRHELLPLLRQKYQPALDRVILRLMDLVGADADLATAAAEKWLRQNRGAFSRLPPAVQRRALQRQLREHGIESDYDLVEQLRLQPNHPATIAPRVTVARDARGRVSRCELAEAPVSEASRAVNLRGHASETVFAGVHFSWHQTTTGGPIPKTARAGREVFDAAKLGSRVILRHWRPGDRFQPIGMSLAVKLQDLFTNLKISRAQRHRLVVATTAAGEIFWVENLRISERFKLSNRTNRRLQWRWKRP